MLGFFWAAAEPYDASSRSWKAQPQPNAPPAPDPTKTDLFSMTWGMPPKRPRLWHSEALRHFGLFRRKRAPRIAVPRPPGSQRPVSVQNCPAQGGRKASITSGPSSKVCTSPELRVRSLASLWDCRKSSKRAWRARGGARAADRMDQGCGLRTGVMILKRRAHSDANCFRASGNSVNILSNPDRVNRP